MSQDQARLLAADLREAWYANRARSRLALIVVLFAAATERDVPQLGWNDVLLVIRIATGAPA